MHGLLLAIGGIDKVNLAIGVGLAPTVAKETAAGRERSAVHALAIVEQLALARCYLHGIEIVAHGRLLVGKINDALCLFVETEEIDYLKRALGELRQLLARGVEEIKMVVSIAARLHHELACVPRQKDNRVHRLDVTRIGLGVQNAFALARGCIVGHKLRLILRAGQFKHINSAFIGRPGYIGEIAVGGVAGFEIDRLPGCRVEDADSYLMARHARHGVFFGRKLSHAVEDVDEREVRHHALVHAVERQQIALRAPKQPFVDAELVAVHAEAVLQLARAVGRDRKVLALARAYIYIVVLHVGQRRGDGCRFRGLKISFGAEHGKDDLLLGPVVVHCTFVGTDAYYGAVCFGKGCACKGAHLAECRRVERGIDVGERAKRGIFLHLLPLVVEKEAKFFHFRLNEAVAPPSGKYRAGLDVPIVRAAPHQVVERELLCALCHNG